MSSVVLDIPRIYTGLAQWLACMIMIACSPKKLEGRRFWITGICGLLIQCAFLVVTDDIVLWLWIPCMAASGLLILALILLLCDLDIRTGAYTTIRAFLLAEFAAALQWQIHCFLWPENDPGLCQRYGLLLGVYAAVFGFFFLLEKKADPTPPVTASELMSVAVIGVSFFAVSNLSFYFHDTPFSGQYSGEIMNIRTFADLGGVAVLFAYHQQRRHQYAQKELDAMQTILENQYAQYRMSRDSIELINRKYHDLKHQIAALRAEQNPAVRDQWLDEIEEDIRSYEAQNKTGNSVLDTVLTGKSLYCQKHGISLAVVADGRELRFMDVMDICTLFGNALDNAIECERKIQDRSKRMIHLSLNTQKQFLLLRVENYCPEPPQFSNGLPMSTKGDAANHGFGVKSIQHTARKYGGTTTMSVEGEWFVLKVLLPLPKKDTSN